MAPNGLSQASAVPTHGSWSLRLEPSWQVEGALSWGLYHQSSQHNLSRLSSFLQILHLLPFKRFDSIKSSSFFLHFFLFHGWKIFLQTPQLWHFGKELILDSTFCLFNSSITIRSDDSNNDCDDKYKQEWNVVKYTYQNLPSAFFFWCFLF